MFRTAIKFIGLSVATANPVSTGGAALSDDNSLGDSMMRGFSGRAYQPITASEAESQGWTVKEGGCQPSLGVEYLPPGGLNRFTSGLSAFYTPAGQMAGLKIQIFDYGGISLAEKSFVTQGYYIPVQESTMGEWMPSNPFMDRQPIDMYEMAVSFRSPEDVCSEEVLNDHIGDRIVINQHTIAESIPMTAGEADATGQFEPGSCMNQMGQHYFKDLVTEGTEQSFLTGNLMPITPMYYPPDDPAGKLNAFLFSWPGCQRKNVGGWDNPPVFCALPGYLMCQNFCNERCSTKPWDDWSFTEPEVSRYATFHIWFQTDDNKDSVQCGGNPTGLARRLGKICPSNTLTPDSPRLTPAAKGLRSDSSMKEE